MLQAAAAVLLEEGITEYGILPISEVRVTYADLFSRDGDFSPKSVLMYAVPYYTGLGENLSAYAVSRDYHLYMQSLSARLIAAVNAVYPHATLRAFADHSPIDERHAAARAGLGRLGDNGLLITPRYGTFVFVGELFSDIPAPQGGTVYEIEGCEHCGACRRACPTGALSGCGDCLSELTQRRGDLAPETVRLMKKHHTVWGCDLCQTACPHTRRAIADGVVTPVAFFREERIPLLDSARLSAMDKVSFKTRAFAWRGRRVVERNLKAYETEDVT